MSRYPLPVRLLVAWVVVVTAAPALLGVAAKLELVAPALATASILVACLAVLGGLVVFERPGGSWRAWLGRIEARLLPPLQQSPASTPKESSNDGSVP